MRQFTRCAVRGFSARDAVETETPLRLATCESDVTGPPLWRGANDCSKPLQDSGAPVPDCQDHSAVLSNSAWWLLIVGDASVSPQDRPWSALRRPNQPATLAASPGSAAARINLKATTPRGIATPPAERANVRTCRAQRVGGLRLSAACRRIGCTGSARGVTTTRAAVQRLSDLSRIEVRDG